MTSIVKITDAAGVTQSITIAGPAGVHITIDGAVVADIPPAAPKAAFVPGASAVASPNKPRLSVARFVAGDATQRRVEMFNIGAGAIQPLVFDGNYDPNSVGEMRLVGRADFPIFSRNGKLTGADPGPISRGPSTQFGIFFTINNPNWRSIPSVNCNITPGKTVELDVDNIGWDGRPGDMSLDVTPPKPKK